MQINAWLNNSIDGNNKKTTGRTSRRTIIKIVRLTGRGAAKTAKTTGERLTKKLLPFMEFIAQL
jgi:hypothetical protein